MKSAKADPVESPEKVILPLALKIVSISNRLRSNDPPKARLWRPRTQRRSSLAVNSCRGMYDCEAPPKVKNPLTEMLSIAFCGGSQIPFTPKSAKFGEFGGGVRTSPSRT